MRLGELSAAGVALASAVPACRTLAPPPVLPAPTVIAQATAPAVTRTKTASIDQPKASAQGLQQGVHIQPRR